MQLAIDTSSFKGQLYLFDPRSAENSRLITWGKESSHSEVLVQKASEALSTKDMDALEEILVVTGPGSFTGLRVGINFAKALAYSLNIPIRGLNTLHGLLLSQNTFNNSAFSIIDAQKNSFFIAQGTYSEATLDLEFINHHIALSDIENIIPKGSSIIGSGLERYKGFLDSDYYTSLVFMEKNISFANLYSDAKRIQLPDSKTWNEIQPEYLKKSAAELVLAQKLQS